jgi:hypothetical protein
VSVSGSIRRHRVAIAANLALVVAAVGVVVVATQADGYRKHDAQLNDGGIWVTNGRDGFHGRINKPIAQLDGVAFAEQDTQLDVVQDGAAVLGINWSAGVVSTIDPGKVALPEGDEAQLPSAAEVQLAGGTAAVLDPAEGSLWAQRVDTRVGVPPVADLDAEADPFAATAADAGLAVSLDGEILVASASDDTLRRFAALEDGFAAPTSTPIGADLGPDTTVTAVGDRAVVLDVESGSLQVVGGPDADLPSGSRLQAPGPDAPAVLVGTPDGLVAVDLATGEETEVVGGVSGKPAEPVRLGACSYGAWSGGFGAVATACEGAEPLVSDLGTETTDLVFRVNRGEILLNDRSTGAVWDIESDQPTRLDNWDAFQLKPSTKDDKNENENTDQGDRRPPQAKDDDVGARLGRTTVLHPLDNDTAPAGRLLAIASVEQPAGDAEVTISPDGQTVQIDMPDESGPLRFDYTIDDGRSGLSDTATVFVTPRGDEVNADPQLRAGYEPHEWTVPSGGTLDIPVLPDWRDKEDGDPLSLESAVASGGEDSGAVARTTSAGRVRFTAPTRAGAVTIKYTVTDGIGTPVPHELKVAVQDVKARKAFPGVAEPDVVSGEAGKTVTIRPLANDLPGSDPADPTAVAQLAGKLAQVGGARVQTDLVDGTVSFTADQPRTYFLDYDLRYGNAPFDSGRIRVDVEAPDKPPKAPVAMPDSVTLHGQAATLVDVVANDIDPTGGILVVQGAEPDRDNQLDVAVVDGRWLRLSARQGQLSPNPQVVRYTISNGARSGVSGEVVVTWRPPPGDNTPVTETDRAVVRAGGAVSVPVLDNDFSPAGDELDLVADLPDQDAGVLVVQQPGNDTGVDVGRAFVSGRFVRYVAPPSVEDAETFTIRYVATNARGDRAPGTLEVQVVPATRRNAPPEPPVLEGRAVSGDTVRLRLPGEGVDPDGDPVTLTGIDSAPALGRIVRYGATSLVYQAYPGSVGTDEFGYTVTDALGATASGTVRVAVVAPGAPQAPLAVPDTITTEPGRQARIDVLANDHVAAGDRVEVTLAPGQPDSVRLEGPQGPLLVDVPTDPATRTIQVVYTVSNGIDSSQGIATVRVTEPYNNPPVVFDAYGTPAVEGAVAGDGSASSDGGADGSGDASTVTVDVLDTAYDPDGPTEDLRVAEVLAPEGVVATLAGSEVTVERGDQPRVVPFRVADADGGSATASIYVPPRAGGAPYVLPGSLIEVEPGETAELDLSDYVVDPAGGQVSFTLADRMSGSPVTSVQPAVTGEQAFTVSADERYQGPAAVVFEVTTGESVDDPEGIEAVLSVPVQVGADDPILRCPTEPVEIAQDRTLSLDIASLCHVWTPDPESAAALSFDADWETSVDGLAIVQPSGAIIEVNADGATRAGSRAVLSVTSGGSDPGLVEILVVSSPPPSLSPIRLDDMQAGEERTVDLAPYLRAGVDNPEPTVLSVEPMTSLDVTATAQNSGVVLRTGAQVDGRAEFRVVMSDVSGSAGAERQVEGRIVVEVLDVPDRPLAPVPGNAVRDQEVALSWRAPEANGAPIDGYEVRAGGGVSRECATTSCEVSGLENGREYRFEVRARNAVGWSEWSPSSRVARPDAKPGEVGPITMVDRGDGTVTIRWTEPTTDTSDIRRYDVRWTDGGETTTSRTELTVPQLDNNQQYVFSVRAENQTFFGPFKSSPPFQSIGTPASPARPTVTENRTSSDDTAVVVQWPAVDPPNGPGPMRYTVLRNGQPLANCTNIAATECVNAGVEYDGSTFTYAVRATNESGQGLTSPPGPGASFTAVGDPEGWEDWRVEPTGRDAQARATFTVPDANGARSRVRVLVNGNPVDTFDATGGQTRDVGVPSNDGPYTVSLDVCNEQERCSASTSKTVQTYGPLNDGHVVSIRPRPGSGNPNTQMAWDVTVDANGDPATVRVSSSVRNETFQTSGVDTYSFTTTSRDLGFSATEQVTVTIFDDSPGRGSGTRSATSPRTDPEPPPEVSVRRGARCQDNDPSLPNCYTTQGTRCTNNSCGYVNITTSGFDAPVTCTINSSDGAYAGRRGPYGNGSRDTSAYFGFRGGWVQATCGGITSPRYTWP